MTEMSQRMQRVADQIQREIATLIQTEVSDPRVGMVSVLSVEVSKDMAYAKVYVTILNTMAGSTVENDSILAEPGELDVLEIEDNVKALNKAAGFLRSLLAKRLRLRSVPKLKFLYDHSVGRGQQLSELIDNAIAADKDLHS